MGIHSYPIHLPSCPHQGDLESALSREKELREQLAVREAAGQSMSADLEQTRALLDAATTRCEKAERGAAELKRQRKLLQDDIKEMEDLLLESERERKEARRVGSRGAAGGAAADLPAPAPQIRQRYVDLGEKMEMLLREERASREQVDRDTVALDLLASERAEMKERVKEGRKAAKRLEEQVAALTEELGRCRTESEERAERCSVAEKKLQLMARRQQEQQRAFETQVQVLRAQLDELQEAVDKARKRTVAVRAEVQRECEERASVESKQLELRYERRVQELELELRSLRAVDTSQQHQLFQQYLEARLAAVRSMDGSTGGSVGAGSTGGGLDDQIDRRIKAVLEASHTSTSFLPAARLLPLSPFATLGRSACPRRRWLPGCSWPGRSRSRSTRPGSTSCGPSMRTGWRRWAASGQTGPPSPSAGGPPARQSGSR